MKNLYCINIRIPVGATEAEIEAAEAKKVELENAGYELVYFSVCSFTYCAPCV
jgi:hypothetical protein